MTHVLYRKTLPALPNPRWSAMEYSLFRSAQEVLLPTEAPRKLGLQPG